MTRPIPDDLSMLASFYRRWEPQEDRRREISDDLKELFAEGKGNGFNAKAMRKAFAAQYRLDHEDSEQREAREQTDEETELYLSALARVRESDVDDEPADTTPVVVAADSDGGSENAPASVDAIQPETANEAPVAAPHGDAGENDSSVTTDDADAITQLGDRANEGGEDGQPVVATNNTSDNAGAGEGETSSAPGNSKLKWNPEYFDAPHPLCKQPKLCGGNSNIVVCETCRAAASNISTPIPITPGEARIAHRGVIQV